MVSIGVGIDIQKISRIRELLKDIEGRTIHRIFSEEEILYCGSKSDPMIHYAGRFTAKEAVVKSLSVEKHMGNLIGEVTITNDENGAPHCSLGPTLRKIMEEKGGTEVLVSISHTDDHAVAFAICQ